MANKETRKIQDAKVIKIINEYSIIINIGAYNGVQEGDQFRVGEDLGEVTDNSTNEKFGHLINLKEKLEVTEVYPKFSILKKVKRIKQGGSLTSTMSGIAAGSMSESLYGKTLISYQKMNVKTAQIYKIKTETSDPISLNDIAVFIK